MELAIAGQRFQLENTNGVKRVRSDSWMWHKERLINLGAKHLIETQGVDAILWMDADTILLDPMYITEMCRCLQKYDLVHGFSVILHQQQRRRSILITDKPYRNTSGRSSPGGLWAAHADFFMDVGLYEYCLIGGGDNAVLCGFQHDEKAIAKTALPSLAHLEHFRTWMRTVKQYRIGYIDQTVLALSHGSIRLRQYIDRHKLLDTFDPVKDVAINDDGVFEWTNPLFAARLELYLRSRQEDNIAITGS